MSKKVIISASLGNFLEMYSFSLFAIIIPLLSPLFFPLEDSFSALLLNYMIFSVGFLSYPIGALIFGYIGDTYGRKTSLSISVAGMGISTCFIGFLPTYSTVGPISPLLLVLLRMLQGICAGGECIGSGVLIIEYVLKNKPGFFGSLTAASGTLGVFIASLLTSVVLSYPLYSWLWRLLFIISILIGFIGWYLRKSSIDEKSLLKKACIANHHYPIKRIFGCYFMEFLCAVGVGALGTVPFYIIIGFINTYLVTLENITLLDSVNLNLTLVLFCALTLPLAGYIADKIGIVKTMLFSSFFCLILAYPLFKFIYCGSLPVITIIELTFLGASQFYVAPLNAFINRLFPIQLRFTGTSLGYCVGMAVFGGLAPYISLSLIVKTGFKSSPFIYLSCICLIGFISVLIGNRRVLGHSPAYQKVRWEKKIYEEK